MEVETQKKKADEEPQPLSRSMKLFTTIVIFYGNVTYVSQYNFKITQNSS